MVKLIAGRAHSEVDLSCSSSNSSKYSTSRIRGILDKLQNSKNRKSTKRTYLAVWRKFNNFVIKLDEIPTSWEERASLYVGYLFNKGAQSSTIKSYISAIKAMLVDDGYQWDDSRILFSALTRGCRLINDRLRMRLPIKKGLLELLLFELTNLYDNQIYLQTMYKCIFCFAYFGLLRIGEITTGEHPVKAKNIHIGENKDKILIILFTSKTHNVGNLPQEVIISSDDRKYMQEKCSYDPFQLTREYSSMRGEYISETDPYFVFQDNSHVRPKHVRKVLKKALKNLGLEPKHYGTHSFRIGRASDLLKRGVPLEEIKRVGRWRSNAVFRYLRS